MGGDREAGTIKNTMKTYVDYSNDDNGDRDAEQRRRQRRTYTHPCCKRGRYIVYFLFCPKLDGFNKRSTTTRYHCTSLSLFHLGTSLQTYTPSYILNPFSRSVLLPRRLNYSDRHVVSHSYLPFQTTTKAHYCPTPISCRLYSQYTAAYTPYLSR